MPSLGEYTFVGHSRTRYVFEVYPVDTNFKDGFAAVYIFSRGINIHTQIPVYIGETDKLGICIRNHEKWPCVRRNDAAFICIHGDSGRRSRKARAQDLIKHYDPTCNLGQIL